MTPIRTLEQISATEQTEFGGKTLALAELARLGYLVPRSLALPCDLYRQYLQATGLGGRLTMELGRKDFSQMRWEELWDSALRVRNLFLTTAMPKTLADEISTAIDQHFGLKPLVIRSSAPGEDSANSSFAGLHDSFVNVCGRSEQLLAIRKVWASLWSDRALLYRQELGLKVADSNMAVLVQELVPGEKSGVAFSAAPNNRQELLIEAVWGLNQGLVDGSIEPDSWRIDRESLQPVSYRAAEKSYKLVPHAGLLKSISLSEQEKRAVLNESELVTLGQKVLALEETFSVPQDCEWTWYERQLILLQARPITTSTTDDPRSWYFNLHRSLANLKQLQQRIENEIMPGMEQAAAQLATVDLEQLSDKTLAEEFGHRQKLLQEWEEAYRTDCIPMAHGIRLFGEFYNDSLQPEDPFEFLELLRGGELRALTRNRHLAVLAEKMTAEKDTPELAAELARLAKEIGLAEPQLKKLLMQFGGRPDNSVQTDRAALEQNYRQHFSEAEWLQAKDVLQIGRTSYRLRDDDNISLAALVREVKRVEIEVRRRCASGGPRHLESLLASAAQRQSRLSSPSFSAAQTEQINFRARQLQGQPASCGLVTAPARVILSEQDLSDFRRGEILVCDAIDPAMTFIVPLAAGIIERRGGMLIHGAIIAREYGIPCVSGIAAAADIINTGDQITVDGYLGLVFFPPTSGLLSQSTKIHQLRKELDDADKN
jgi:pyruvate,water dikinase